MNANRAAILCCLCASWSVPAGAAGFSSLYSFGPQPDAGNPSAALVIDSAGNLYGPAQAGGAGGSGAIFELSPDGSGGWSEAVLHSFSVSGNLTDGVRPMGRLALGSDGTLFGTTSAAGGPHADAGGTVFKMTPPAAPGGTWSLTNLHVFATNKIGLGGAAASALLLDPSGVLYGTTPGQGAVKESQVAPATVYSLTPPAGGKGGWTFATLYSFPVAKHSFYNTVSGPVEDSSGTLYGSVLHGDSSGTFTEVYALTPPAGGSLSWTESVIAHLPATLGSPVGELTMDSGGALYGATSDCVFRLDPPGADGGAWNSSVLNSFSGYPAGTAPRGGVAFGSGGQLYGNLYPGKGKRAAGVTYSLTAPAGGSGHWTLSALEQFSSKTSVDGVFPVGELAVAGGVFGVTAEGGTSNEGTVFEITP